MNFVDIPVIAALDYFHSALSYTMSLAVKAGKIIAIIGLVWTAFELIMSRKQIREALWGIIFRFAIFIIIINMYIPLTNGLCTVANKLGTSIADTDKLVTDLNTMRDAIYTVLQSTDDKWEYISNKLGITISVPRNSAEYSKVAETTVWNWATHDPINTLTGSTGDRQAMFLKAQEEWELEMEEKQARLSDEQRIPSSLYSEKTLEILNSILLTPAGTDPENGIKSDNLISSYIPLNIWLDGNGNDSKFISSAAIVRMALLACQIIWANADTVPAEISTEKGSVKVTWFQKQVDKITHNLLAIVLAFVSCVGVLLSSIFACIQYTMTCIEFCIIQTVGALFLPFYLFDATKDLPKKLINTYFGIFLKFVVMDMCLLFVMWLYMDLTRNALRNWVISGIDWTNFATIIFTIIISFILTSNAPKIAMTLLTGQPQLSMGEFVAAVGTAAGAARYGYKGAAMAKHGAENAVRGGYNKVIDTAGGIQRLGSAVNTARHSVKGEDNTNATATRRQRFDAGSEAALNTIGEGLKNSWQSKKYDFLHGGKGNGGAPAGGMGGPGTNPYTNMTQENSLPGTEINNFTNPSYKNYREEIMEEGQKTGRYKDQTIGNYMAQKREQGSKIGEEAARKFDYVKPANPQNTGAKEPAPPSVDGTRQSSRVPTDNA